MAFVLTLGAVACVAFTLFVIFWMRPGAPRRLLVTFVLALLGTPTIVVGHGIGIAPASWVLFTALHQGDWDTSLLVSGLAPIALVWPIVFGVAFSGSKAATWSSAARGDRRLTLAVFAAFGVVTAAAFLLGLYRREF